MKKTTIFGDFPSEGWPAIADLEPFFVEPSLQDWSRGGGSDDRGFRIRGLDGTDGLPEAQQVEVNLYAVARPGYGVYLFYDRWDGRGRTRQRHHSKGDLSRLYGVTRTVHGSAVPIGLCIPFKAAWSAVKEFIETDGALPKSIEWIASADLPDDAFPDAGELAPRLKDPRAAGVVIFMDRADPTNEFNGKVVRDKERLLRVLDGLSNRPPSVCELISDNEARLTIGIGKFGCAQYDDGCHRLLVALADRSHQVKDDVEFLSEGTPRRVSREYCLPLASVREIAGCFLDTGAAHPGFAWKHWGQREAERAHGRDA